MNAGSQNKLIRKSDTKDKKKGAAKLLLPIFQCDRGRIRTCDRLLRRQMLYPAELRDLIRAAKISSFGNLTMNESTEFQRD